MASVSEEERLRRSERAKALHAEVVIDPETGVERRKFGGPQPGSGRKREVRASEVVARAARDNADALATQLLDIAKDSRSDSAKIQAIAKLLDMEREDRDEQRKEEAHRASMHRDDLIAQFMDRFEQMFRRGLIDRHWVMGLMDENTIDATDADFHELTEAPNPFLVNV